MHLCQMKQFLVIDSQMKHVHSLRVRYADTDRMDMVYHGTFAAYLEAARVEMLRDVGWVYSEMEKAGTLLPVVKLQLDFLRPARYDQLLEVHTYVVSEPTSKVHLRCEILHEGTTLVKAEVVLVCVAADTGRPCRAPEGLVSSLRAQGLIAD